MANNTATNAFYFNFCNAFAKQFNADLTDASIKALGQNVKADAKNILKVTNLGIAKFQSEKAKYTKTSANKYAAITEKLNKSLESDVVAQINAYIETYLGYCSKKGKNIIAYTNDNGDEAEYEYTPLEEQADEDVVIDADEDEDDDIADQIEAVPAKTVQKQSGIKKPITFNDDDDDIAPPTSRKSTTRIATSKTSKGGAKGAAAQKTSSKASVQLDKKWLQLTVQRGAENVNSYFNESIVKSDLINKANPLTDCEGDDAEINKTILAEYGKMYKELAAAMRADKEKAAAKAKKTTTTTKAKVEIPTNKEIDAFVVAACDALNAESALLDHYDAAGEDVSKIECKPLNKAFESVHILSITRKVLDGKKTKNELEQFTATLDKTTIADIKKNYKKKQLKQTITGTELLKSLIQMDKIDNEELGELIQAFYDAYIALTDIIAKIKKIKMGVSVFNSDVYFNTDNAFTYDINTEFKAVHPVEALIYKSLGLFTGKYVTEAQNRSVQTVESSSMYRSFLHIALHDFTKPISAKIFETIFNNRFSYIEGKEIPKLIRNAFTQAAGNLSMYLDENENDEIAKLWFNIVKADTFIRGLINNYQLSKSFLAAFKALYSNKLSYKLYVGPLYPISFLFTPFMLKLDDTKCDKEMAKLFKEYIEGKAKTVSTAFNKKFFNECTEQFMAAGDWIYYLKQNLKDNNSVGDDLRIMSILFNKFDKGEIEEDEKATKEKKGSEDEENEENDEENDEEGEEDKDEE